MATEGNNNNNGTNPSNAGPVASDPLESGAAPGITIGNSNGMPDPAAAVPGTRPMSAETVSDALEAVTEADIADALLLATGRAPVAQAVGATPDSGALPVSTAGGLAANPNPAV